MIGTPYIPENITVHLGRPDDNAPNITVSFPEYVKNVASSEIFPTWPENALRANIYVIVTYALNRIYTEWYRSKGYDFDITNNTQYDQAFVEKRNIFENISILADELFNDYITRDGFIEPYFSAFCNGTTSKCDGLSQWGTVSLAQQGLIPYEILQYYYGKNINIVFNAPVRTNTPSYPGIILSEGDISDNVKVIQVQLNRISSNFPAIPKIPEPNGYFGPQTSDAVRFFQGIFNLNETGTVDKSTWYRIAYIFTSVKKLSELNTEGIKLSETVKVGYESLSPGSSGTGVSTIQYFLAVIGAYYERVQPVAITGFYDQKTKESVQSFQQVFGLKQTGNVDAAVWNDLLRAYLGIVESVPAENPGITALFPGNVLREGQTSEYIRIMQEYLSFISSVYPQIPSVSNTGYFGPVTRSAVTEFQKLHGINPSGTVGAETWNEIASVYSDLKYGQQKHPYQYPGYIIR